jgi:hypothetical protein
LNKMACFAGAWFIFFAATLGIAAEPLSGLLACRTLTDSAARLACFDRESAALAAKPMTPAAAAALTPAAPPARAAPVLDPKKQFGLPEETVAKQEIAAGTRAADETKIEARVTQVTVSTDGRATLTLDNGQVWRQLVADVDLMAKPGESVVISRAALKSYWLETGHGRGGKVSRLH